MRRLLVFNLATDADDQLLSFTTGWVNRLAAHYDALDVITMRAGRLEVAGNVRVFSVGKERGYSEARRTLEFYRLLRARLSEGPYVACFAHMMPLFAMMGAPLLRLYGVPITLWYTHRNPHWTVRAAVPLVRRAVTATPDSFPVPTKKLRVLGHGIDTEFFSPDLTPQPPLHGERGSAPITQAIHPSPEWAGSEIYNVVHVARLMPIKRQDTLIHAVAAVPGTRAVLVGDVPPDQDTAYPGTLATLAAELGAEDRVTFAGAQSATGVRDAYRSAFAAVNLSPPGLFDKAALEAMACAVPTIVTNPAFDDLLGEDVALLRIRDADDVDGLIERLRTLQAMPATERAALGGHLRERIIATHSLKVFIPRLIRVLESGEPE